MDNELKELRVSNDAMHDGDELQRRLADEGYLFFKQLQDPDKMMELRLDINTVLQEGGWLLPGTDPMNGIADVDRVCTEGDEGYTDVYHKVYALESFHRSAHLPEIVDMIARIAGKPVLPHPQKIARLWFPQYTEHTTPTHQDYVHFQGSFDTWTAWAPVGDCPVELGGLAVLPGSHKVNRVLDHHFSLGAGGLNVEVDGFDGAWHTIDYEPGDTLIFEALMIHRALPNVTDNRMRISLDNRYFAIGNPVSEGMMTPHLTEHVDPPITWEEIYADWQSDDLKYYWEGHDFPIRAGDPSYSQRGFEQALEMARNGNEHAQLHLRRVVRMTKDEVQAQRALEALGEA